MEAPRTWRAAHDAALARLIVGRVETAPSDARWITLAAAGVDPTEFVAIEHEQPPARALGRLDAMVARRLAGVPVQYVIGSWSFRSLDLMVDERVLIPRPETEWVVEIALREAEGLGIARGKPSRFAPVAATHTAVDLGTGSGAIGLALEAELPTVEVWATDVSPDALVVARANAAGNGATRVRYSAGEWFGALPAALAGTIDLLVSNPPYVALADAPTLPLEVIDHEPGPALFGGPDGFDALAVIIDEAPRWLAARAALVLELDPRQAARAAALARARGFDSVAIEPDLTGRDRVLVARRVDSLPLARGR
jgi:release factor glutamine methyltransferase